MSENYLNGIRCPKCGSFRCSVGKRGVSLKKSIFGEMLFGEGGFLWGFFGRNDDVARCVECGYEWEL